MSRARRRIIPGRCYEICFRARQGLPFVVYQVIELLIESAIARAQRDVKVILCHDIWNGSHCHIICVCITAEKLVNFYKEIEKNITDSMKKLLGISHLRLWEGRANVAEIGDLEAAIDRIAYLYANPAQDDLEESIDLYPGYSSWKDFLSCKDKTEASARKLCKWIRLPSIPLLKSPTLTPRKDSALVRLLTERNREEHDLVRHPNAWLSCFGKFDDGAVSAINKRVIDEMRKKEEKAAEDRAREGRGVLGAAKLRCEPILKDHVPKKNAVKVFFLSSIKALRVAAISEFKIFCEVCRRCYQSWRQGDFSVTWPPEAFRPSLPPSAQAA